MFSPEGGQKESPDFDAGGSGGEGAGDLPPDILYGFGGDNGPVLPAGLDPEVDTEDGRSEDLLDIGLHFYEKMNEI